MIHILKEKRDTQDPKAKKLIFIGYVDNSKEYRLIDPKTNKIIISRDVKFLERKLEHREQFEEQNTYFNCLTGDESDEIQEKETQVFKDNKENTGSEDEEIFQEADDVKEIFIIARLARNEISQQSNLQQKEIEK